MPNLVRAATPTFQGGGRVRVRFPTRIGILPGYAADGSETATARQGFIDTVAGFGRATVVEVTPPPEFAVLAGSAFNNVRLPERSEPFMPFLREDLGLFGVSLTSWLQGALLGANKYVTGQRAKLLLLERVLDGLFAQCDVVVQTSPVPFDIIGLPEIAFPIGFTTAGVPIGTILGGQPYAEDSLLAVVAAYQAATDWHVRRPPDPPVAAPAAAAVAAARTTGSLRLTAEEVAEATQ